MPLLLLGISGCGDDTRGATTDAPAPSPSSTEDAHEAEIKAVADRYLRAFAAHDWEAVCGTREPAERRELAQTAGSCEKAFETLVEARPGVDKILAEADIGDVRIRGDIAGVDVVQPGQSEPATTLAAVRKDGRWFLQDMADSKTP